MLKEKALSVFKVRSEEMRMVVLVAALFLCIQAGQGFGENAAFALFLSSIKVDVLPYMYMGLGGVVFLVSVAYSASLTRFQNSSVVINLLAGEVCDARQAKRLFPLFTSMGILGSVLGNSLTGIVANNLGTNSLIVLYALGHIVESANGELSFKVDFVFDALNDPAPVVRREAIRVISLLNGLTDYEPVLTRLSDEDVAVRMIASETLKQAWPYPERVLSEFWRGRRTSRCSTAFCCCVKFSCSPGFPRKTLRISPRSLRNMLFIVVSGEVDVIKLAGRKQNILATRWAGEFVGEMAILESAPRSAALKARGDVRVLTIEGDAFSAILLDRPEVAVSVLKHMSSRLRELNEMVGVPLAVASE